VFGIVKKLDRKLSSSTNRKNPAGTSTWRSYLMGSGSILLVSLSIGAFLAFIACYFGPWEGKISKGGRLTEYRQLNPAAHVIYEEQDVEAYHRIVVVARTMAPQDSSVIITIYGDSKVAGKQEIDQIQVGSDSWSQWDQGKNSSKRITLKISNNGTLPVATQVDVLLYFFPQ
jgi:hypothetical protein